jgi:hypothetical protein
MSQFNLDNPIVATTKSGTTLAADLTSWRTALHTSHSGASVPSYAVAGMQWYDSTLDRLMFYDGAQSITMFVVDETNNVAFPLTQSPRFNFPVSAGTANAQTLTLVPALTAYADGDVFTMRASASNTDVMTLNVNAVGAKAVRKIVGGADVALVANDIIIGNRYTLHYSTAANAAAGGFIMIDGGPVGNANIQGIPKFMRGAVLTLSAGGTIAVSAGFHTVDTFAAAASDTIENINFFNGGTGTTPEDGMVIILAPVSNARSVIVGNNVGGTGNVFTGTGASITLSSTARTFTAIYRDAVGWVGVGTI